MRKSIFLLSLLAITLFTARSLLANLPPDADRATGGYAVAVSKKTESIPAWKQVVDALAKKHHAKVLVWDKSISEIKPQLTKFFPKYLGIVIQPKEGGVQFVRGIYALTRSLNKNSSVQYGDVMWGIITGYTPKSALRIVQTDKPLVVETALNTTGVNPADFKSMFWISDGNPPGTVGSKSADGKPETHNVGTKKDRLPMFVNHFNSLNPDVLITSSHANVNILTIPFAANQGYVTSRNGKPVGITAKHVPMPLNASPNPKVFLAAGNCLIGNIHNKKSLALAFMNTAGVNQFVGYTVETWFGQEGWGTLKFWEQSGGRLTLSEAFFLNNQNLLYDIAQTEDGKQKGNLRGMKYDRDVLALYGDPAWSAVLDAKRFPNALTAKFSATGDQFSLKITVPKNGANSVGKDKPFGFVFPQHILNPKLLSGQTLKPILTETFLLIPDTTALKPGTTTEIRFTGKPQFR